MNTEWFDRIKSETEKFRRFKIFNGEAGFGSWLEFRSLETTNEGVLLRLSTEAGDGWVRISDEHGTIRAPFDDRNWCYGVIERRNESTMMRLRLIDEQSSGQEAGIRAFLHWKHGSWKKLPITDGQGRVSHESDGLYFGWSPGGNAYFWEPKPEAAKTQEQPVKTARTFTPNSPDATSERKELPEKKPKMFVPKQAQHSVTATPPSEKKPKIFVPKAKKPDGENS